MDSSSTSSSPPHHQNWLAFSLSNQSHQLSLFNSNGGVPLNGDPENGPKLADFLGGAAVEYGGANGSHNGVDLSDHVQLYDDSNSELKTLAASFFHGFDNRNVVDDDSNKRLAVVGPSEPPVKKANESYGQRTSIFRGVTRHRWTGRYEAHLWDNSCRREGQSRKGRQVYLGGYDKEEKAARAYDLAALKYWGPTTTTNFPVSEYEKEIEEMNSMTRQEFVASLRRKSSGFSRGASMYRGVTRHHQHGRWQARIGRVAGNKDLYLGTFSTQEEAAEAYDIAAIKFRGLNAVTNFDMSRYDVRSIASSNLPVGGVTNKSKTSSDSLSDNKSFDGIQSDDTNLKDLSSATSLPFPAQNSAPPEMMFSVPQPIKQDQPPSLWAALGYPCQNTSNSNCTTPYTMEYNPNLSMVGPEANGNGEEFYGYYRQQQGGEMQDNIHNTEVLFGLPSVQHHQLKPNTAKTNLGAFHTPIFGLE